jgi:hypothetical protein
MANAPASGSAVALHRFGTRPRWPTQATMVRLLVPHVCASRETSANRRVRGKSIHSLVDNLRLGPQRRRAGRTPGRWRDQRTPSLWRRFRGTRQCRAPAGQLRPSAWHALQPGVRPSSGAATWSAKNAWYIAHVPTCGCRGRRWLRSGLVAYPADLLVSAKLGMRNDRPSNARRSRWGASLRLSRRNLANADARREQRAVSCWHLRSRADGRCL